MTQKELILSWGKGEAGSLEQTAELSLEKLVLTYRQLKAIDITSRVENIKANLALVIRAVRQRVQEDAALFYIACGKNEYPYQDSDYGIKAIDAAKLSIQVFWDEKAAQTVAEAINRNTDIIGAKRGRPAGDIVHVARLGDGYNMTNINHLKRLGVSTVYFGEQKDNKTDLILRAETLTRQNPNLADDSFDFFDVAPKAYAYLCLVEQATNECRPDSEIKSYQASAFECVVQEKIGVAISKNDYEKGECNPFTIEYNGEEYVELFTDWASMIECLGNNEDVFMAVGNWNNVISFNMPVVVNREATMGLEGIKQFWNLTKTGRLALAYIADCYHLNIETTDGLERAVNILNDIRTADPINQEFCSGLSIEIRKNSEGKSEQYAVFNFPEGDLFMVNGNTAKQFFENNLCDTPAAAYHVLAVLYNDKDGSAMRAFENAELYE